MKKNNSYQTVISFLFLILVHSCVSKNQEIVKFENGIIRFKCDLKNGIRHGKSNEYFPNGAIKATSNWVAGVQDGHRIDYFETGSIEQTSMWKDGKLEGECVVYFENGGIKEITYNIEGQPWRHEFYDEDSRLQEIYDFAIINGVHRLNGHIVYDTDNDINHPYNINSQKSKYSLILADRDTIDYGGFVEYEVQWVCSDGYYVGALTGNIDRNFNVVDSASLKNVDLGNKNRFYPSQMKTDTLRVIFEFMIKEDEQFITNRAFLDKVFTVREK